MVEAITSANPSFFIKRNTVHVMADVAPQNILHKLDGGSEEEEASEEEEEEGLWYPAQEEDMFKPDAEHEPMQLTESSSSCLPVD